jgi:hypothetical protein
MEIDWKAALDGTKPVTTRDGRKVTLYCIDAPGAHSIHGRIEGGGLHGALPYGWQRNGLLGSGSVPELDLIQPKVKHTITGWVNVHTDGSVSRLYNSPLSALNPRAATVVACIPVTITYTEGEGLD